MRLFVRRRDFQSAVGVYCAAVVVIVVRLKICQREAAALAFYIAVNCEASRAGYFQFVPVEAKVAAVSVDYRQQRVVGRAVLDARDAHALQIRVFAKAGRR